jgi:hypothetical protein
MTRRKTDSTRANRVRGADRAIRISTAAAVASVAGITAYVSYWHADEVVRAHGEVRQSRVGYQPIRSTATCNQT